MLTDLLTSSRGPGVIGTVMALIVLLGFGGLTILVFDDSKGSGVALQVKQKEAVLKSLVGKPNYWKKAAVTFKANRANVMELESMRAKTGRRKKSIEKASLDVKAVNEKTAALRQKFEQYKARYRISERSNAVGEEMPLLKTLGGKIYENVKIKEVTALEMRFSHKNGNTGVGYEMLPRALQNRFQFSKNDAIAMTKIENKTISNSVEGGERYRVSKEILDRKNKIRQNNEYIQNWNTQIRRNTSEMNSNKSAIEAALERASHYRGLPNRGLNWDNAKKYGRKADRLRKKSATARSQNSAMQGKVSTATSDNRTLDSEIRQFQREFNALKNKKK